MGQRLDHWELGFNQFWLHLVHRTCGASRYIPSRLSAFPTCCFSLCVSTPGRLGVLEVILSTSSSSGRNLIYAETAHDSGIPISVIGMAARDTTESGLTLAVRFCTVAAHMARARRVARVNRVQWDTSKSGLVGKKLTELSKGPTAMPCTLRVSNRAFGSLPNVP